MSSPTGRIGCACCGRDLGAPNVVSAVHVGDMDPDNTGQVRNLWFCRVPDDDGRTCAGRLLDGMTVHYDQVTAEARAEVEAARAGQDAEQETPYPTNPPVGQEQTDD